MNTFRSALSAITKIDGRPADQHPLVISFACRFSGAPAYSYCHFTWDPELVLNYLKHLGPDE